MPLGSLRNSPRAVLLSLAAAGVAPFPTRVEPFVGGNPVKATAGLILTEGTPNTLSTGELVGCAINRFTALKYLKFSVAKADVTPASGVIGQTAAAREADGDVSGDLTITLGNAAGQLLDSIPDHTNAADADTHLGLIVLVNGVPYGRIVDAASPNPAVGQYGMDNDTNDNFNIIIGASTGTDVLKVGTEIEIAIGLNIGKCAEVAAGVFVAGTSLAAGLPEERYLGAVSSTTDTAGRTSVRLVKHDFVMAETTPITLSVLTK